MHARTGKTLVILLLLAALTLSGCLGRSTPAPGIETGAPTGEATIEPLAYTQAAETISAELTLNAPPTTAPEALPTETEEPLPPTSTPLPTDTPLPSDTPTPTGPPPPTNTPIPLESYTPTSPPEPNWQLAWNDDFTTARFWNTDRGENFRLSYSAGGYMITNNVVNDVIFSVRTEKYSNVRIEVTASWQDGPFDSYYGVICNFLNGGNYYLLAVGADGWYGILKKMSSQISVLIEGRDISGAVRTGAGPNTIRGECYNGDLILWSNGAQIAKARDLSFNSGLVGLGVGARKTSGVQVVFDDFFVYTISNQPLPAVTQLP
ncbi:MAG: hypothetical protein QME21_08405 [Anaerolineales bacterium]|nr:hypothetical protein [Anaerolineales bacterium]